MWWLLLEAILEVIIGPFAELKNRDAVTIEHDRRAVAFFVFFVVGLVSGIAVGAVLSIPSRPFGGPWLLALPLLVSAAMEGLGRSCRPCRCHLTTWWGGAALGLGLAVGRLWYLWETIGWVW
jgi:hypothetical protein